MNVENDECPVSLPCTLLTLRKSYHIVQKLFVEALLFRMVPHLTTSLVMERLVDYCVEVAQTSAHTNVKIP